MRIIFDFDSIEPLFYNSKMPAFAVLKTCDKSALDAVCRAIYVKLKFHVQSVDLIDTCDRRSLKGDRYEALKYRANFNTCHPNGLIESLTMYIYIPVVVDRVVRLKLTESS